MSHHLPPALLASLQSVKGFDENEFIAVHESGQQLVSVRLNPYKKSISLPFAVEEKVPWCSNGYYLPVRPSFTTDPLFHSGAYYVQEASSMFLEEAVKQTTDLSAPLRVLDLCAAPGGKSTLLQSLISGESLLVANELIKTRVNILAENITKWGAVNVVVTNNDPKDFQRLPEFFDLIVVDAPCSGSGLFRKDAAAIGEWSESNVELCSQRQKRILADVMPALKPGGTLIYSTCSYSMKEDEDICDWLLSGIADRLSAIRLALKEEWNIVETSTGNNSYGYRFYPDKLKGEGFFIAAFRKESAVSYTQETRTTNKLLPLSKQEAIVLREWLEDFGKFSSFKWRGEMYVVPQSSMNDIALLQSALYLKKAGVKAGSMVRDELIPDHELAVSTIISPGIPFEELTLEDALQYLRRAEIKLLTEKRGWALVKYNGLPLGWVKLLQNRLNNYYPKDWRILNK